MIHGYEMRILKQRDREMRRQRKISHRRRRIRNLMRRQAEENQYDSEEEYEQHRGPSQMRATHVGSDGGREISSQTPEHGVDIRYMDEDDRNVSFWQHRTLSAYDALRAEIAGNVPAHSVQQVHPSELGGGELHMQNNMHAAARPAQFGPMCPVAQLAPERAHCTEEHNVEQLSSKRQGCGEASTAPLPPADDLPPYLRPLPPMTPFWLLPGYVRPDLRKEKREHHDDDAEDLPRSKRCCGPR
eukprot:jgi/Ulvmu1/1439/UM011_0169.1